MLERMALAQVELKERAAKLQQTTVHCGGEDFLHRGRWDVLRDAVAKINRESFSLPLHLVPSVCRLARARRVCALAAFAVLVAAAPTASAVNAAHHRHPSHHATRQMLADVDLPILGYISGDEEPEGGQKYELKLARRTGEVVDVIYRVGDRYIPEALDNLSQFLRDSHNDEVKSYNPRTFDILHTMLGRLSRTDSVIEVLCGYRTKETNDELRKKRISNAAEHSEHIDASAIDFRVPGVPAAQLRNAALSLNAGGVGYYPRGQFVHVDTGPVRKWTYVPHRGKHTRRRRHT